MEKIIFTFVPILDKNQNLFGHHIKLENKDTIDKEHILDFIQNIPQKKYTLISIEQELLVPEILEMLNQQNVILITKEPVERFKTATYYEGEKSSFADYIIITDIKQLSDVKSLNKPVILEGVKTQEEFDKLKNEDIDLFEGYFYTKKKEYDDVKVSPSKLAVLNIFNAVFDDFDINKIEEEMKRNPDISIELLKFINSAAFSFKREITSIRQAITLLGQRQFLNWLLLSIYLADEDEGKIYLFETAAIRGKMVEILASKVNIENKDEGFLVGILSTIDVMLNKPLEEVLEELNVAKEIKMAILKKEGILGKLLSIVENLEEENLEKVEEIANDLQISIDEIMKTQFDAIMWFNQMSLAD